MRKRNQQIIVLFGLASMIGCAGEEAAMRSDDEPVGVAVDGPIDAASSFDAAPSIDAPEEPTACRTPPSSCDSVVGEASACPTISFCSRFPVQWVRVVIAATA